MKHRADFSIERFSVDQIEFWINRKKGNSTMVRMSKPERKRHTSYKRPSIPGIKGPSIQTAKRLHVNAIQGDQAVLAFIPKIS
jgi:hypothetical protein